MTFLYILLALLVFGLLVMIHELGHFLIARLFGVGIREFSIGMGPKLFSWKGKKRWGEPVPEDEREKEPEVPPIAFDENEPTPEPKEPEDYRTTYSLRLLPIGGYVSMVGEDEESDHPAAFGQKNVWKRIAIVVAGAFMNILLGFLLMLMLVLITKTPDGEIALASNVVAEFDENATSNQWLQENDVITHVNGTRVHTGNEVIYEIMNQGYQPLDITVERNGEEICFTGVVFPGMEAEGISFGDADFKVYREEAGFGTVLKHTFFRSISTVKMIFDQLGDLLTGRFGFNAVSGPIGITEEMGNAAKSGFSNFLYLVIVITINLGVFNLLPIPALDGGRLLFLLIEAIIRRPVNPKVEGYIHFAGLMILFGIMILVACKDIAGLFV
ncbi:MAG: site-2 protease family protein [Clostridia bacterium]|nr:site-2 protease family protein [Clostridia bacterium]